MQYGRGLFLVSSLVVPSLVCVGWGMAACTDNGVNPNAHFDSGSDTTSGGDGGGMTFKPFTAPTDPGGGGILITASGEVLSLGGFLFPPKDPSMDTYMEDGWNFVLTEYITVFDHVEFWDNPNIAPMDQSMHGGLVAHVDGPWVADLHKGGNIMGKGGGGEQATPIAAISKKDDGSSLDPTVTYGFGFSTIPAPMTGAYNVNLDSSEMDDYAYMVAGGYSVLYVGTATFMGSNCVSTNAGAGPDAGLVDGGGDGGGVVTYVDGGYDYSKMPRSFQFRMGFDTPTNYVNCQNGTDLAGPGVNGEDHPRGVQVKSNQSITAQVTIHMDHPFWESFAENSPLHWDQIAGQYVGMAGVPLVHTEDMKGVAFTAFTDKTGTPLPWRNCAGMYYTPPGNGQMAFDPLKVPVDPNQTDPTKALRDYYDYIRYTQSTQGHLNSQGLCFISRQYPSPGGGS
jgi:hypothetical protein